MTARRAAPAKTRPDPVRLTVAHRRRFSQAVCKWQRRLNLQDWRIGVSVVPARKNALAEVTHFNMVGRVATIRLSESWDENNPPTDASLEAIACHEVLHIFLYEMGQFYADQNASEDDKASAEHRVIQVLVGLMAPGG